MKQYELEKPPYNLIDRQTPLKKILSQLYEIVCFGLREEAKDLRRVSSSFMGGVERILQRTESREQMGTTLNLSNMIPQPVLSYEGVGTYTNGTNLDNPVYRLVTYMSRKKKGGGYNVDPAQFQGNRSSKSKKQKAQEAKKRAIDVSQMRAKIRKLSKRGGQLSDSELRRAKELGVRVRL